MAVYSLNHAHLMQGRAYRTPRPPHRSHRSYYHRPSTWSGLGRSRPPPRCRWPPAIEPNSQRHLPPRPTPSRATWRRPMDYPLDRRRWRGARTLRPRPRLRLRQRRRWKRRRCRHPTRRSRAAPAQGGSFAARRPRQRPRQRPLHIYHPVYGCRTPRWRCGWVVRRADGW